MMPKHDHTALLRTVRRELPSEELLCDLSDLFKVFGDTTRMRILYSLFESELCVCAIAELLGMTQSAISHQLKVLRDNKLVAGQGFEHLTEHDHREACQHNISKEESQHEKDLYAGGSGLRQLRR